MDIVYPHCPTLWSGYDAFWQASQGAQRNVLRGCALEFGSGRARCPAEELYNHALILQGRSEDVTDANVLQSDPS